MRSWFKRAWQSALLFGFAGTAVSIGANLLLVPLLLLRLSQQEQALWWMFLAIGSFANLADFGFSQTITRVYSYLWAGVDDYDAEGLRPPPDHGAPNLPQIRRLNATVKQLYARLGFVVLAGAGAGGSLVLARTVGNTPGATLHWLAWAAFVLSVAYGFAASHWIPACYGINRMREMHIANLWGGVAYLVSAAALLLCDLGLAALVIAFTVRTLLVRGLTRRAYLAAVPPVPGPPVPPDPSLLKRLWPNAYKFGLIALGACLTSNSAVLICGHFLGAAATASFGLTATAGSFLARTAALWLSVKWPQITILRTQGRLEEMSLLFARRLGLVMLSFVLGAALLLALGDWVLGFRGNPTRLLPTSALALYLLLLGMQLFYAQFGSLAYTENVIPFFRISLWTGLVEVLLSVALAWRFGLWGLLAAPLLAELYSCWFTVRRGFQGQPLSAGQLFRAALTGRGPAAVAAPASP